MNKKTVRNKIALTIVKVYRQGKLFEWQASPEFTTLCATMQEHKISRKSIYTTIEALFYAYFTKDAIETLHDFCYTFLPK